MDRSKRLSAANVCLAVLVVLVMALVFASEKAFALDYVSPESAESYTCVDPNNNLNVAEGGSAGAACSAVVANMPKAVVRGWYTERYSYSVGECANGGCALTTTVNFVNNNGGDAPAPPSTYYGRMGYSGPAITLVCPKDTKPFTRSNGQKACACDGLSLAQGNKCVQYTCPPSGGYSAITQPDQKVPNAGDGICTGGCGYTPSSWKVGQDGQIWATWPFKSTGKFCGGDKRTDEPALDSGEKNSNNPAPVPCGTNQCPGTVNGVAICVPCKSTADAGTTTAASAPGTGASGSTGAGDTTTTKQTECNGVSCTTTTTTRDGSGNVVGQVKEDKPQESFCAENPGSPLCKKSSFGGQCSSTVCEGDAVQCAIAADQYRRNCQWFDDPGAAQLAADAQSAMNGQAQPDGHPAKSAQEQSISFATAIDQMDRLAGSCPADVTVSVSGRPLTIPFSSMCQNLQIVGNLMVGFCMLVAALIVFRS